MKPIDYACDLKKLQDENKLLKEQLEEANAKADSIQKACESYLSEEAALRKQLKQTQEDLEEERQSH